MIAGALDWFDRHRYGVVGTLMLHTVVLFIMAMSKLPAENQAEAPPEMVMEMAQPEHQLPPDPLLQPPAVEPVDITNKVSNEQGETRSVRTYLSHAAQERMQQLVDDDLNSFAAAEFARRDSARKAQGKEIVIPQLDSSKWKPENYLPEKPKALKVEGQATVDYSFVGGSRSHISLDIPAYLCVGRAVVVIDVQVDASGSVRKAEINEAGTSTGNECMRDNALASARSASFTSGKAAQQGTIRYTFLAQ